MPNLGFPEIMIILVVALLVFGPKKLPDLGRSLGNGIREFRKGTQGLKDELEGSLKAQEVPRSGGDSGDQRESQGLIAQRDGGAGQRRARNARLQPEFLPL